MLWKQSCYFQWDSKRNQICWTTCYCRPEYKPQFSISNVVFFSFWAKIPCWGYRPVTTYIILATACTSFAWKWRTNTGLNMSKGKCHPASMTISQKPCPLSVGICSLKTFSLSSCNALGSVVFFCALTPSNLRWDTESFGLLLEGFTWRKRK